MRLYNGDGVVVMSKAVFILTLVVILALTYLALQNPADIQLKLFQKEFTQVPLYMVIFGSFLVGAAFVYLLFLLQGIRGIFLGMKEKRLRRRDERTEDYRQEAKTLHRLGELEKSKALLEKAIHLTPDNLELSLDLADVLLDAKQYTQASDRYHHVFSRDPQNARALLGIAASSEAGENFSEAELHYRRILNIHKTNSKALEGLFRVQKAQHKWQDAMETLRLLRREDLVSAGDFERTLAVLWYEEAIAEEDKGHLKAAISALEKSLKADAEFVPSILDLGNAQIREGSTERTVKIWEAALMEHFHIPVARALETHMVEHGQERDLIQFYRKASNRHQMARLLLAKQYLRQDLLEDAEAEANKIPDVEASPGALLILAEVEKKRLNEGLANRHYSLAVEILHQQLNRYRCSTCATLHDQWMAQCRKCRSWNSLRVDLFLP